MVLEIYAVNQQTLQYKLAPEKSLQQARITVYHTRTEHRTYK